MNTSKQQNWRERFLSKYSNGELEIDPTPPDKVPLRALMDFIQQEINNAYEQAAEVARGKKKTGNNGEGLPFENSPEIYGNQRIEAYKNGNNQACEDIAEDIIKLKK